MYKICTWSCLKTDMNNFRTSKTNLQKMIFKTKNLIILKKAFKNKRKPEVTFGNVDIARTKFQRSKQI